MKRFIILHKIDSVSNQEFFTCASEEKIDQLLADEWMFYLTNETMGYESEAAAWVALANTKSVKELMSGRGGKLPSRK